MRRWIAIHQLLLGSTFRFGQGSTQLVSRAAPRIKVTDFLAALWL
jgi:hypothetical protein